MRSDRPAIVLRHVSGPRCDVGRLQIATKVRDQRGKPVLVQDFRGAFTGEISPTVDFISGFVYTPLCSQKGPTSGRHGHSGAFDSPPHGAVSPLHQGGVGLAPGEGDGKGSRNACGRTAAG